jgi:hypothetical protein
MPFPGVRLPALGVVGKLEEKLASWTDDWGRRHYRWGVHYPPAFTRTGQRLCRRQHFPA